MLMCYVGKKENPNTKSELIMLYSKTVSVFNTP